MKIETTTCDACQKEAMTAVAEQTTWYTLENGYIHRIEEPSEWHFCSMRCVATFATDKADWYDDARAAGR